MPNQPSLFASKAPRVSEGDVAWMLRCLDGVGWRTALTFRPCSDRTLRAIAAASQGRIISGQRGYARTDQASVEDVRHAADWMRAQAKKMIQRANEIEQAMHKREAA